ncbi:aconitase family protein [Elioraea tepida]|uniref:aconitase family protein n=1 Tax=Elioraea tepida TaxID=2843330 RepID=UPI001F2E046F|nr:aconitase family protein [Elioraea tepida]
MKTSLAPGSQVVTEYLEASGLQADLDALGFNLRRLWLHHLHRQPRARSPTRSWTRSRTASSSSPRWLSGNRNFEGRVHANVRANYLASPPLVVAYAIAGTMTLDLATEPLGTGRDGTPVFLRDIWPSNREIAEVVGGTLSRSMFQRRYGDVFKGREGVAGDCRPMAARPIAGTTARPT